MYNISDQYLHKVDLTSAKWQKKCGLFSSSFTRRSILCHLGNSSKQKGVQSPVWVIMPTEREVIKGKRSTGLYLPVEIKRTTAAASWEPWFNSGDAQSQQPPLSAFIKPGMFSHTANWLLDEALQTALYSVPFDFNMNGALKECSTEEKIRDLCRWENGSRWIQSEAMSSDIFIIREKVSAQIGFPAQLLRCNE